MGYLWTNGLEMNTELAATIAAAAVAVAAGVRKARSVIRHDAATDSIITLLRQEVERLAVAVEAAREEHRALLTENATLRSDLEQRDRDHHKCQMALNRLTFDMERRDAECTCGKRSIPDGP